MSQMTLRIVAELTDKASKQLKKIESNLDSSAKSADKAAIHFANLSRIFGKATSAIINYTKAYSNMQKIMGRVVVPRNIHPNLRRVAREDRQPSYTAPISNIAKEIQTGKDYDKFLALQQKAMRGEEILQARSSERKVSLNQKSYDKFLDSQQKSLRKEDLATLKSRETQQKSYDYYNKLRLKGNETAIKDAQKVVLPSLESPKIKDKSNISNYMQNVRKNIKETQSDLTKFNQVLFTTTAFIGTFAGAAVATFKAVGAGAQYERIINNYERVGGKHEDLISSIISKTDVFVDQMAAMKAAVSMKTLGITSSVDETAELIARASVAAKNAGYDSAEGIQAVTRFLETSDISLLKHLNLVRENDPALKIYMATLGKYGGLLGSTLTSQEKMNIGLTLLRHSTASTMTGFSDLVDLLSNAKQSMGFFGKEVGVTIGKAITPFLGNLNLLFLGLKPIIRSLRESDKGFIFLIKSILGTTTALTTLIATVGLFRLSIKGLTALGIGLPKLVLLLGTLVSSFSLITKGVKGTRDEFEKTNTPVGKMISYFRVLGEKLQLFGSFMRGAYEILTSFFEPENYSKGIGFINAEVAELLAQFGLLTIEVDSAGKKFIRFGTLMNFVRYGAIAVKFFRGILDSFKTTYDFITTKLGILGDKLQEMFGKNSFLSRGVLEGAEDWGKVAGKLIMTYLGFKVASGALTKALNIVRPSGTKSNPIWVRMADGVAAALGISNGPKDGQGGPKGPTGISIPTKTKSTTGTILDTFKTKARNTFLAASITTLPFLDKLKNLIPSSVLSMFGSFFSTIRKGTSIVGATFGKLGSISKVLVKTLGIIINPLKSLFSKMGFLGLAFSAFDYMSADTQKQKQGVVAGAAGGMAGGALGSLLGPVGTVVGGVAGYAGAQALSDLIYDKFQSPQTNGQENPWYESIAGMLGSIFGTSKDQLSVLKEISKSVQPMDAYTSSMPSTRDLGVNQSLPIFRDYSIGNRPEFGSQYSTISSEVKATRRLPEMIPSVTAKGISDKSFVAEAPQAAITAMLTLLKSSKDSEEKIKYEKLQKAFDSALKDNDISDLEYQEMVRIANASERTAKNTKRGAAAVGGCRT